MKSIIKKVSLAWVGIVVLSITSTASAQRLNKLIEMFENDEPAFGVLSFD